MRKELDRLLAKITSFADLPVGWHYGEGGPIPEKTISLVLILAGYMYSIGLLDIETFAGCDGEISLEAIHDKYNIDVIVKNDCSLSIAYDFDDKQVFYKSCLNYEEAIKEISGIMEKAQQASGKY